MFFVWSACLERSDVAEVADASSFLPTSEAVAAVAFAVSVAFCWPPATMLQDSCEKRKGSRRKQEHAPLSGPESLSSERPRLVDVADGLALLVARLGISDDAAI